MALVRRNLRNVRDYPGLELGPVAVDGVEVGAAVGGAALGVDGGVEVGAAGAVADRGETAIGLLPAQALGSYAGAREADVGGEGRDVSGDPRVDPGLPGADVLRM